VCIIASTEDPAVIQKIPAYLDNTAKVSRGGTFAGLPGLTQPSGRVI
jgi:hypothetical protein